MRAVTIGTARMFRRLCVFLTYLLYTSTAAEMPMTDSSLYKHSFAVIGGGLSGLSAALEASRYWEVHYGGHPVQIVVLDKEPRLGGNSMKASSGINAVDVSDRAAVESFLADTRQSGGGLSDDALVETLVTRSGAAIEFLQSFGVDLSGLTQLGGHSTKRTRFNPAGANVGLAIMKQLIQAVEADPRIVVQPSTRVMGVTQQNNRFAIYRLSLESPTGESELRVRALVLATGGFGANRTLLEQFAPQAAIYATTNGPWSTGDGLELAEGMGAELVHLEEVQIHPTGFVDPKDPSAGSKILAAEKLRGCGAIMLNAQGRRFVDELNRRDHVYSHVSKQKGEKAWLLLSAEGGALFNESHMGFYMGRGLIKKLEYVDALAEYMQLPVRTLKGEMETYNAAAIAQSDEFGKTAFPSQFDISGPFFISLITPVVHYTMGGVKINAHGQVLRGGEPLTGFYAAGEVTGGLHGRNRLGGNSLLDCVVFGRQAAHHAMDYIAQTNSHEEL